MNYLQSVGTALGVIASLFSVCGLAWKMFIKKWWTARQAAKKAEWNKLITDLSLIKGKIFPNGGSSLDDKMEMSLKDNRDIKASLLELRAGQRNTWEIMDVAVWISNDQGATVYVNKPYCELVGHTYPDAIGMSWLGLIASADRTRIKDAWKDSIDTISDFDQCYSFKRSDGMYQKVNGMAIHNRDKVTGKLVSSMGRLIKIGEPTKEINS